MHSGIIAGIRMIRNHQIETGGNANYLMFVLTDGLTDGGVRDNIAQQLIVSYGIQVYGLGYTEDARMGPLEEYARLTEGHAEMVTESNVIYTIKKLFEALT